ncbi:GntR family transcriptional regulator [Desulfonispora thiosulfatigenes DSM 11270]|uniref:GntR family transcriptional regulator n=1 Tax=Desulfonispora thiosulfatigenes DSM 11270 TaxID=656914 RepID=A0A1W1UVG0_DESTI|nr:GntR family transcriptional regulator [Desulfonispora thiosulfatigenes]SMB85073.1 GntR family transcriptional regulator [Desulfonispora thiosulfatigenes DSM 11270]
MFQLDFKSRKALYEQIIDKFKQIIIKDVLKPDEQMPSVRDLAKELTINPNTIQKAYRELERQGYIYTVKGRGNFVSPMIEKVDDASMNQLKQEIHKNLSELIYLGVKKQELIELVEKTFTELKGGSNDD